MPRKKWYTVVGMEDREGTPIVEHVQAASPGDAEVAYWETREFSDGEIIVAILLGRHSDLRESATVGYPPEDEPKE